MLTSHLAYVGLGPIVFCTAKKPKKDKTGTQSDKREKEDSKAS